MTLDPSPSQPSSPSPNSGRIPMSECILGRLYQIKSSNMEFGVYDGEGGFIGIREKFGQKYLFTEYHVDQGAPFGTVYRQIDTGIDLPKEIKVTESLGSVDSKTGRPVAFDAPVSKGGRGWYFTDTNEASEKISPYDAGNKMLFDFLYQAQKSS